MTFILKNWFSVMGIIVNYCWEIISFPFLIRNCHHVLYQYYIYIYNFKFVLFIFVYKNYFPFKTLHFLKCPILHN